MAGSAQNHGILLKGRSPREKKALSTPGQMNEFVHIGFSVRGTGEEL
jgi:hypothetical protein